jgi:hypothetical protein
MDGTRLPIAEIPHPEPLGSIHVVDGMLVRYDSECGPECRFQVISPDGGNPQTFVKTGMNQELLLAEPRIVVDDTHLLVDFRYSLRGEGEERSYVTEIWLLSSDGLSELIGYNSDFETYPFDEASYSNDNRFVLAMGGADDPALVRVWDSQTRNYVLETRIEPDIYGIALYDRGYVLLYQRDPNYSPMYYRVRDEQIFNLPDSGGYSGIWYLPDDQLLYSQKETSNVRSVGWYIYNVDQDSFTPVIEGQGWLPCVVWSD